MTRSNSSRPRVVALVFAELVALLFALSAGRVAEAGAAEPGVEEFQARYRALLQKHTSETQDVVQVRVDYRALGLDTEWGVLVDALAAANPDRLRSREEKLAFWINAYNILAIDLVRGHYPVDSIKSIGSFFRPVWGVDAGTVGGRPYSLDEIEHRLLRPLEDPRIHGAIVCASVSCPPLARVPFTATGIDAELDAAQRTWLANPEKGARIDRERKLLVVSKIFDWFEDDFEVSGGVVEFVARYLPESDAAWLRSAQRDVTVRHFDYDWNLND